MEGPNLQLVLVGDSTKYQLQSLAELIVSAQFNLHLLNMGNKHALVLAYQQLADVANTLSALTRKMDNGDSHGETN